MHVDINLPACEGHGLCAQVAPDVYELDDEGYVRLLQDPVPETAAAAAAAGARVCPVTALSVRS